mmetsp:Transcript_40470/g.101645  ORF Transcript_40470/g.101645 Transcript_40470/m.101645 type:complete len:381 (-) Transcript_40470:41-1183(-)
MDLSKAYLNTLGDAEAKKLADLRSRLPLITAKAREASAEAAAVPEGGFTLWRVRIEEQSDASDIVLLKYLRAEELDVDKAQERVVQTLVFRADCKIDELAEAELPEYFQGHDFITGVDEGGRPIMISRFGGMDIEKVFGDAEAFVRYRAKLMENAIALLKFERGAPEDLTQVHDYSGVLTTMFNSNVKNGVTAISKVFSEHYPEFKGKTLFVNFPAVFSKPFQAFAALMPERTRKKFMILGQDDHLALFEHLGPGLVPDALGGLLREPRSQLSGPGHAVMVKARDTADVAALELVGAGTVAWELRVCTYEVSYEVVFAAQGSGEEEVIAKSEQGQYLKAEDGVVAGQWTAGSAGSVRFRFRNECAWFKRRVCACRAELMS